MKLIIPGMTVPCSDCRTEIPDPNPHAGFALKLCASCMDARKAEARRRAVDEAHQRHREWLQAIGVPRRFWDLADFDLLDETPAVRAARTFLAAGGWRRGWKARAPLFLGPTGTGKTQVAAAIHGALLPDLHAAQRFTSAASLARRLSDYRTCDEVMDEMTSTPLLTIDDLGALEPKAAALIEELICAREADERALIITSNLQMVRLNEMFSDRVADRLRSWGDVVECRGSSRRKRPGTQTA